MISQPACGGGNIGVRQARAEAITLSSGLTEFVTQPVDVSVINAGQAPEFLVCDEAHADGWGAAVDAPSVAVAMDAELRVCAQNLHCGKPDGIHADHDAHAFVCHHMVVAAQHLVDVAGKVHRIHDLLAGSVGMIAQHAQNGGGALFEGTVRPVGLQFVVFDEVDPRLSQRAHLRSCLLRVHADARFDDGADERTLVHAREPASSRHAKLRALIAIEECRRQAEVEQFES